VREHMGNSKEPKKKTVTQKKRVLTSPKKRLNGAETEGKYLGGRWSPGTKGGQKRNPPNINCFVKKRRGVALVQFKTCGGRGKGGGGT